MLIAKVAVRNAAATFDMLFSYIVPPHLKGDAVPGKRVIVPFNKRDEIGMIFQVYATDEGEFEKREGVSVSKLREIITVIDSDILIDEKGLELVSYIKETTFSTFFSVINLFIPVGIRCRIEYEVFLNLAVYENSKPYLSIEEISFCENIIKNGSGKKTDSEIEKNLLYKGVLALKTTSAQNLGDKSATLISLGKNLDSLTKRQQEIVDFILENGEMSKKELEYYVNCSKTTIDSMVKKGILTATEIIVYRNPYSDVKPQKAPKIHLNDEQSKVYSKLHSLTEEEKFNTALLYGVTGSGKTLVFIKLVMDVINSGKSALILVPEISLTPQTIKRFHNYFGDIVAVLHSGLSVGERSDEFKRIKNGEAKVVVGTRSAVFAPLSNIGIIVIDEEHEGAYKSEQSPRYHARSVAAKRASQHNALLLLCSATPSVESYYKAIQGKLHLVTLEKRYGNATLPKVLVVDMKGIQTAQIFSESLLSQIDDALLKGHQVILLLNRRGHNTVVTCEKCKTVSTCPNCSASLTYHTANDKLVCHLCGYKRELSDKCNVCGSEYIKFSGVGTQRAEKELQDYFKSAKILRLDSDTTQTKNSMEASLEKFKNKEYDILIGTQMVAKGLDFDNVTLVGVLNADNSLYSSDFRSFEKTFSLITQVVGRSGRGKNQGMALIQTYSPEHPVISEAANQDYKAFFQREIIMRKALIYPPFCDLCQITFMSEKEGTAKENAHRFFNSLIAFYKKIDKKLPFVVLGPAEYSTFKVNGKYRYKIIIKTKNNNTFRELIKQTYDEYNKKRGQGQVIFDFFPESF